MKPMTRSERAEEHFSNPEDFEHLYARGEDDESPPSVLTKPEMDFFQVSRQDCMVNFAKEIDNWTLFDPKEMDCGADLNKVNLSHGA